MDRKAVVSVLQSRTFWIFVALVAAGWLAIKLVGNPLGESRTLGRIMVDTPEIYTRERLVNDRFLQEAWLSRQLEPAGGVQSAEKIVGNAGHVGMSVGTSGEKKPAPEAGKGGGDVAQTPSSGTRARLLEEIDYRELVRSLTIENQLDDRHDLNGNALYKLKFDASVLPGVNTQANAQVTVRVLEPVYVAEKQGAEGTLGWLGSQASIKVWRALYHRWIESLSLRLNQTHKELKHVYHNSEFSHTDYARLIDFLGRHLRVQPADVPVCRGESMVDARAEDLLPLGVHGHAARKQCIAAIVDRTIPFEILELAGDASAVPLGHLSNGASTAQYVVSATGAPRARRLKAVERSAQASAALDHWLNSFFASKTVRLVLGVAVPEEAFVRVQFQHIPVLNKLARLTFFNALQQRPDVLREDAVFSVAPKDLDVMAIDPRRVSQEVLDNLAAKAVVRTGLRLGHFVPIAFAPKEEFVVLDGSADNLDGLKLTREVFKEIADGLGVWRVKMEPGLYNFAAYARQHNAAFTYAVTPKESADLVNSTLLRGAQVDGQASAGEERARGALNASRDLSARALERRPTVVGFSGAPTEGANAEFGWLIGPRHISADGQTLAYTQSPSQYSLSALVSLPAWWNSVRLRVTTHWIDKDGAKVLSREPPTESTVELPPDFEALEVLLLGIEQIGPELMDARLDPVLLTACQPGSILIPGRRLWRSTKVTLGYQTASSISVLPNMKGIIARFDKVENQLSVEEEHRLRTPKDRPRQIHRTIRVWTSQGSLTLPVPASIGIPAGTARDCREALTAQGGG